jgi:uncharacterized membrane protein YbaN (DUF454 family)
LAHREHCSDSGHDHTMIRPIYFALGLIAFGTGFVGIFLPLLPTVPFMLLAAFLFSRSNPEWEARLLRDPRFGPSILAWRQRRAIPRTAKVLSTAMLAASGLTTLALLEAPWRFVPVGVAVVLLPWIWSRPD